MAYNDALQQSNLGHWQKAKELAEVVLGIDPNHPGALWISGTVAFEIGEFENAAARFEILSSLDSGNAEVWLWLGNVRRELGRLEESAVAYRRAVECDRGLARAHGNLGVVMNELGRHEEAVSCHGHAIALDGRSPRDHFNLAVAHYDAGDLRAAADGYRAAIAVDGKFTPAHHGLGGVLRELGEREGAIASYRDALEVEPDHAASRHMLASLTGVAPPVPPMDYVSELFDNFAPKFDDHMINRLAYATPQLCRAMVDGLRGGREKFANAIDLGCGTGLAGERFRDITGFLCGVDVSDRMIVKAREKQIYDHTEVAEICGFLETTARKYDLFIAADVVVYFGGLQRILDNRR